MARRKASFSSTMRLLSTSEKRISSGKPMPRLETSSTSSLRSILPFSVPPGCAWTFPASLMEK